MNITIEYLTHKQFKAEYGGKTKGIHLTTDKGDHLIKLPYHASTRTRCHELAHAYNNDMCGNMKLYEIFECEVKAEVTAYRYMNRPLNSNILYSGLSRFNEMGLLKYLGLHWTFNKALSELTKYKVIISNQERSELWHYIKKISENK